MNRKNSLVAAIILTIALLASSISSYVVLVTSFGLPTGADSSDWYKTVEGVLASDTYTLYPYAKKNLKIGFSKFGELINALPDQKVGLEYGGEIDPFAPMAGTAESYLIPQKKWFNGWLINITYYHLTASPHRRCVWAIAMHAAIDTTTYGNGWIRVDNGLADVGGGMLVGANIEANEDPGDDGYLLKEDGTGVYVGAVDGGRKTNGSAITEPIQILYDGPRRFVAQMSTIIFDVLTETEPYALEPLVKITFTVDFNKVKKEVVVLKDVKLLFVKFQYGTSVIDTENKTHVGLHNIRGDDGRTFYEGMYVQFSNRGEWDLGVGPNDFRSYVHFYTDGPGDSSTATGPECNPTWEGLSTVYGREYALIRTAPPNVNARWGLEPDRVNDTYDVAQIISADLKYVGWAAFWPSLSDWTVAGVHDNLWWRSLTNASIHREDMTTEPTMSPFIIGEWDFILTPAPLYNATSGVEGDVQFRGVTVYGVTDLHTGIDAIVGDDIDLTDPADNVQVGDGDDANRTAGANNIIDREVYYQLQEVFNPKDLAKATKNPRYYLSDNPDGYYFEPERHVLINTYTTSTSSIDLPATFCYLGQGWCNQFYSPVYDCDGTIGNDMAEVGEWFAYSTYAERILVDGKLLVRGKDYVIKDLGTSSNDRLNMTVYFTQSVKGRVKILYSVCQPAKEWVVVGRNAIPGVEPLGSLTVDSIGAAMVSQAFDSVKGISIQWSGLDIRDPWHRTVPFLMRQYSGTGERRADYKYLDGSGRTALKDDWSTTVPIASSEIVSIGGPISNMVTEYFNEFTSVVGRLMPEMPPQLYWMEYLAVADWGANRGNETHSSKYNVRDDAFGSKGWALISVYKDINGTVGFLVWGLTGNDTYWASQALYNTGFIPWKPGLMLYKELRCDDPSLGGNGNGDLDSQDPIVKIPLQVIKYLLEDGWTLEDISLRLNETKKSIMNEWSMFSIPLIWFLEEENPGVTSIILEIDYSYMTAAKDFHPMITIVEEIGTISEKPQHPDP